MNAQGRDPTAPPRERMLPLTAAAGVAWVALAGSRLAGHAVGLPRSWWWATMLTFMGLQWGMPLVAGVLTTGWREGAPDRRKTLCLASAAGTAMDWLFLLTLHVTHYYHNLDGTPYTPPAYVVWWGVMGALFGANGYGVWGPLARTARRGPRLHLRPR
jgi:hypothetical protein